VTAVWDPRHLPSQTGKTFVVTGGNAGIGYFTGEQLAEAGGRVIIAARNRDKADVAMGAIRSRVPRAEVSFVHLDLTSLASISDAAGAISADGPIDALVNNAGLVIAPGRRRVTADGLELLVGGNALGHFALTAQLFPALAPGGRVVGLGSMSTRMVRLDPSDLLSRSPASPRGGRASPTRLAGGGSPRSRCSPSSPRARTTAPGARCAPPSTRMPTAAPSSALPGCC
jgi:NAD(P)-dependent dehydrogenase (short-subunit alcohol dehydrogenase family)